MGGQTILATNIELEDYTLSLGSVDDQEGCGDKVHGVGIGWQDTQEVGLGELFCLEMKSGIRKIDTPRLPAGCHLVLFHLCFPQEWRSPYLFIPEAQEAIVAMQCPVLRMKL